MQRFWFEEPGNENPAGGRRGRPKRFNAMKIPVLASGRDWLAVDKPAGVTVHNDPGRDLCSLVSAFLEKQSAMSAKITIDPDFGIRAVHRLDRETSGVVLLAASRNRFRFFSEQFASRQVDKRYVAVVHGDLKMASQQDLWDRWHRPLGKTPGGRRDPRGSGKRQPSETRFRVLGRSLHYTLIEIALATGRKHQIRRHAKLAGHPVAGDRRYGSMRAVRYLSENFGFDRLALHARELTLLLPDSKGLLAIETPDLPAAMRHLFENDRKPCESSPAGGGYLFFRPAV